MSTVETSDKCSENLLCGVNTVKDSQNMTDLEKKHIPAITAPKRVRKNEWFEVTVEAGKFMAQPSEPGHYIDFIELYVDHTYLARMDFTPRTSYPVMKTRLRLDHVHGKLRAFGHCNLHGTWEADAEIEVTD